MAEQTDIEIVDEMAGRHRFSPEAVRVVLRALQSGGGGLAQFNHPDLGGMGQWSGGLTMIGDMFNRSLKAKVGALAADLSRHVLSSPASAKTSQVSIRATSTSAWWPSHLGNPTSTGSQNGIRYALFPEKQRLAIEDAGTLSVYDTAEHIFVGAGQQQDSGSTLTFHSQQGPVRVSDLKRVESPL